MDIQQNIIKDRKKVCEHACRTALPVGVRRGDTMDLASFIDLLKQLPVLSRDEAREGLEFLDLRVEREVEGFERGAEYAWGRVEVLRSSGADSGRSIRVWLSKRSEEVLHGTAGWVFRLNVAVCRRGGGAPHAAAD